MSFAGKVWRLLVGIKDGLVLVFMLLFFALLFAILSARPSPGMVRDGALLIELDGYVVEEKSEVDPFAALLSQEAPVTEYEVGELVRALDSAAGDDRIKAVAIDLSRFLGGGQVHLQEVGEAMARVRVAKKPVLVYSFAYGDDALQLAAHASEVWVDPIGGAVIGGPGGAYLFYGDLLKEFDVNARVYRVGTHKAATEPYTRRGFSDEARENIGGLYGAMWEEWKANVKKARPAADLDLVTKDPVGWVQAAKGDLAQAALTAGLVDKLGDRTEWGARVAEVSGEDDWSSEPGAFASTDLGPYLVDTKPGKHGRPIGIITIAGDVVDGDAGPGTAGGDRIAELLDDALDDDLAALVVRIDTPGGSVTASEQIRRAILRHKALDIPVAISMANVAASAGYSIASTGDRIFAQPETVTGSIGVFAVVPTFEKTAARFGIHSDGVPTTPLSGQPDIIAGFTPEVDAILQASVEDSYADFITHVSEGRKITPERLDAIAQGRVWDGGTARQLGLVDQFGGLGDALEWAAKQAGLEDGGWYPKRLGTTPSSYDSLIRQLLVDSAEDSEGTADVFAMLARQRNAALSQVATDLDRLTRVQGVQAYCLECPREVRAGSTAGISGWLALLGRFFGAS
ncbi:signal peptide peptidase SppA [Altererythrobacter sp. Z27]|uniref:signal peptide peptidase SppA n=1 Tax=Altererythrobacter sp. Z27 TaxID=3461147 RepID=UPI00404430AA